MKLSSIQRDHIINAGIQIDSVGIPNDNLHSNYWVTLPNGREYPFKYLTRIAYEASGGKEIDFQSNDSYRGYVERELKFPINFYKEGINFFTPYEVEHFEEVGGEKYRKDNSENVRQSQLLRPLVYKMNKWAELTTIEDFTVKADRHWHWSGTFKTYLWIRLFLPESSRKVFFIVGVSSDDGGLYISHDCLRSNYTNSGVLPQESQNVFDEYLAKTDYNAMLISKTELRNFNWDSLVEHTTRFFYKYAALYDELENLVNPLIIMPKGKIRFALVPPPDKTRTYLNKKRTFAGHVTDWAQKQTVSKALGDAGENLVMEIEKEKLRISRLFQKADEVCKVKDGCGYDISSFDIYGNEIHIEVKTTTGKIDEPFYFSINEREYCEQFPKNYVLYRLHEFKFNPDRTSYFTLSGEDFLKKAKFEATNFEVSF